MTIPSCFLCNEFVDEKRWPTEIPAKTPSENTGYLLTRLNSSFAIVGLGALTPGYTLIASERHAYNVGELTLSELNDFIELKSIISSHLKRVYGDSMFFEHGASVECRSVGACVDHVHMHALPSFGGNLPALIPSYMKERKINSLFELRTPDIKDKGYLFFEDTTGGQVILESDRQIHAQFMRRIWAQSIDRSDYFDYTLFPEVQNMRLTYEKFLEDMVNE